MLLKFILTSKMKEFKKQKSGVLLISQGIFMSWHLSFSPITIPSLNVITPY